MKCQLCLDCTPVGDSRLGDLLSTALQWLDYRSVRGISVIKKRVLSMMGSYDLLVGLDEEPVTSCNCRRSLFRFLLLFVPDRLKKDFVHEFLSIY